MSAERKPAMAPKEPLWPLFEDVLDYANDDTWWRNECLPLLIFDWEVEKMPVIKPLESMVSANDDDSCKVTLLEKLSWNNHIKRADTIDNLDPKIFRWFSDWALKTLRNRFQDFSHAEYNVDSDDSWYIENWCFDMPRMSFWENDDIGIEIWTSEFRLINLNTWEVCRIPNKIISKPDTEPEESYLRKLSWMFGLTAIRKWAKRYLRWTYENWKIQHQSEFKKLIIQSLLYHTNIATLWAKWKWKVLVSRRSSDKNSEEWAQVESLLKDSLWPILATFAQTDPKSMAKDRIFIYPELYFDSLLTKKHDSDTVHIRWWEWNIAMVYIDRDWKVVGEIKIDNDWGDELTNEIISHIETNNEWVRRWTIVREDIDNAKIAMNFMSALPDTVPENIRREYNKQRLNTVWVDEKRSFRAIDEVTWKIRTFSFTYRQLIEREIDQNTKADVWVWKKTAEKMKRMADLLWQDKTDLNFGKLMISWWVNNPQAAASFWKEMFRWRTWAERWSDVLHIPWEVRNFWALWMMLLAERVRNWEVDYAAEEVSAADEFSNFSSFTVATQEETNNWVSAVLDAASPDWALEWLPWSK